MKKFFYSLSVVTVIAIATFNVLTLRSERDMSQLRLANIEALSDETGGGTGSGESSEWGCGGVSTYIPNETLRDAKCQIWGLNGSRFICVTQDKVCCDPSKQTNCTPIKVLNNSINIYE